MRIAITLGVLIALAAPARAGSDVGIVVTGDSWLQPQVVAQFEAWLSQHGHTLVPSPMPPDAVNALTDCFVIGDQGCARGIVQKRAAATSLIYTRVESRGNSTEAPDLTFTAYWFDKGHDAIALRKTCQRCNDQLLHATTDEILKKLVGGGDLGHVILKSAPPGARITIDGQAIGVTPLDWDLPPGKHTIQMDKAGRTPASRDVVVGSNKRDLVVLTLPAQGEVSSGGPSRAIPLALLVGGGAALVTGGVLIAIDEDPSVKQRYYRNTAPPGVGLAIGGVVAAGVGAYWLWFRSPRTASTASTTSPTSTPVAAVTGDSAYIGWLGRF